MSISVNGQSVSIVEFKDGSTILTQATILVENYTFVRDSAYDGQAQGAAQYAWYSSTRGILAYTEDEAPNNGSNVYYQTGEWYSIVTSYTPAVTTFEDANAIVFNGTPIYGVQRTLILSYSLGMIDSVTVTRDAIGYEPTAQTGVIAGTYDSQSGTWYYTIYPGDTITISANPSAGHRITGGTGTFVVDTTNTVISRTITAEMLTVEVSGQFFDMDHKTYEYVTIKNKMGTSIMISSIGGRKLTDDTHLNPQLPYSLLDNETILFQNYVTPEWTSVVDNYTVTVHTDQGDFYGLIISYVH